MTRDPEVAELGNRLTALAEDVRAHLARSDDAYAGHVAEAIEAGRSLLDAKQECVHGQWAPFLVRSGIHERKAQRLMKLARSGMKSDTVSFLGGISAALAHVDMPALPAAGSMVACLAAGGDIAYVAENPSHAGHYDVAVYHDIDTAVAHCTHTKRPLRGGDLESGLNAVWLTVTRALGCWRNIAFTILPADDLYFERCRLPAKTWW